MMSQDWADESAENLFLFRGYQVSKDAIAAALRKARADGREEARVALEAAGYATELTRLRADLEKAKEALRKADAMQQLAYANGMKEGWNLGDAGDSETHAKRVAALVQEAMKELKDIRLLSQLESSK